jgi:hypothetical protein
MIDNHLTKFIHPAFSDRIGDFSGSIVVIKRSIGKTLQERRADIMDKLDQHGLTKDELSRKRRLFDDAKKFFQKNIGGPLKKAREAVNIFLDVADVILDSLAMVVPVAGALKEVKGAIKAVVAGITYSGEISREPTSTEKRKH